MSRLAREIQHLQQLSHALYTMNSISKGLPDTAGRLTATFPGQFPSLCPAVDTAA